MPLHFCELRIQQSWRRMIFNSETHELSLMVPGIEEQWSAILAVIKGVIFKETCPIPFLCADLHLDTSLTL